MAIPRGVLPHRLIVHTRERGSVDRFNSPGPWSTSESKTWRGRCDPTTSVEEDGTNRNQASGEYLILLEPSAVVTADDWVEWTEEGITLAVIGTPQPVHDGRGRRHHIEVEGIRIDG